MKLTLGFSPCPNDTFIFDALVNGKIDTGDYSFDVVLEDVQTLNQWAIEGKLDVSKISYGVLPLVLDKYKVLHSGGALGKGVGPLLIAKTAIPPEEINHKTIAVPGVNTTAHMLFSLAFPNATNKQFKVFHEIESAVLTGEVDAGVIIHETRFTYADKGLHKIIDLGEYWEKTTGAAIPLGGIVAGKHLPQNVMKELDALIKQSVEYAFANNHEELAPYVQQHAQEMSVAVMKQHINLYVNNYSIALGDAGKKAVSTLLGVYQQLYPATNMDTSTIFVD